MSNNITNMFPTIWLNWETSKGKFWLNCDTNEKYESRPDVKFGWQERNNRILYSAGTYVLCAYAKYHKELDRLEIAACTIDTTRTAKTRVWKYAGNRYFIDRNKNVFDENGNPVLCNYRISKRHYCYDFKNLLQMYIRLNDTLAVVKEFQKFLGSTYFTNGHGKAIIVTNTYHIYEWYMRKQKNVIDGSKVGKEQKLTNELTAFPLTSVEELSSKYLVVKKNEWGSYYSNHEGILYFERISDDWSVIRVLNPRGYGESCHLAETERFYINDNGKSRIVTPANKGWVPTRQLQDWGNHKFVNAEEAAEKCNRIKYILPMFEDDKKIKRCMFTALRFPEVEQLAKLGYHDVARNIAASYTPKANIKEYFGYYNEKEKNLLRRIGMNKHQLDKHLDKEAKGNRTYYYGSNQLITLMRDFFGDDFIHLDNATFDKYYDAFEQILSRCGSRFANTFARINVDQKKFIKNMVRVGGKNNQAYHLICDTVNSYLRLDYARRPEVNWFFDSFSDVVRTHDAFMAIYLEQEAERRAYYDMAEAERRKKDEEKRIKMDKERKQYEYEDDNYIIRLPKDGNEITKEGLTQHICIGNYVSRHSRAETNLFFLRQKSEPDKSFYAIEMNNDKCIVQIHGFGNRWLGNNPDAIPTVIRWLRKNEIKCSDHILTCKATGYGSSSSHVPMPVVD